MTIARQGTRAFTRKCQAQVQKEDASIMGPRGVIEIWGHFLVIHQITPITDGFMKLRSSFSRELTFIIPQEITKECVGLTPPCDFHGGFRVIFMGDHIYIYIHNWIIFFLKTVLLLFLSFCGSTLILRCVNGCEEHAPHLRGFVGSSSSLGLAVDQISRRVSQYLCRPDYLSINRAAVGRENHRVPICSNSRAQFLDQWTET